MTKNKNKLIDEINQLAPFGCNNPQPVFLSRGISFKNKPVRFGKNNFKGWITDGQNVGEVVGFGMASIMNMLQDNKFDIIYHPYLNSWEGIDTIRLSLKDTRVSE